MRSKIPQIILHNYIKIMGKKHHEHSSLSINSHQNINWYIKHNNIVFIIVKEKL